MMIIDLQYAIEESHGEDWEIQLHRKFMKEWYRMYVLLCYYVILFR